MRSPHTYWFIALLGLWALDTLKVESDTQPSAGSYFSEPNPYRVNNADAYGTTDSPTPRSASGSGESHQRAQAHRSQTPHAYVDSNTAHVANVLKRRQLATKYNQNVSVPKAMVDSDVHETLINFGQAVESVSGHPGVFTPDKMSHLINIMAVEHPSLPTKLSDFVNAYGTPIISTPATDMHGNPTPGYTPAAVARDAMIKYAATVPGMHTPMMAFFEQENSDILMGDVGVQYGHETLDPQSMHVPEAHSESTPAADTAPRRQLMPGLRSALGPADLLFVPLDRFQEAASSFGSTMSGMNPFSSVTGSFNPMSGGLLDTLGSAVMGGGGSTSPSVSSQSSTSASTPASYDNVRASPAGFKAGAVNNYGVSTTADPVVHAVRMPSPYLNTPIGSGVAHGGNAYGGHYGIGGQNHYTAQADWAPRRPTTAAPSPPGTPAYSAPPLHRPPPTAMAPAYPPQNMPYVYARPGAPMPPPTPMMPMSQQPFTSGYAGQYGTPANTIAAPAGVNIKQPNIGQGLGAGGYGGYQAGMHGGTGADINQPNIGQGSGVGGYGGYPAGVHGGAGADINQPNIGQGSAMGANGGYHPGMYGGIAGGVQQPGGSRGSATATGTNIPTIASVNRFNYNLTSGSAEAGALPSFANLFPFSKTISVTKTLTVTPTTGNGGFAPRASDSSVYGGNISAASAPSSAGTGVGPMGLHSAAPASDQVPASMLASMANTVGSPDSVGQGRLGLMTQLYEAGDAQRRKLATQVSGATDQAKHTISQMASAIGEKFGNSQVNKTVADKLVNEYLEPLGMTSTLADYMKKNFAHLHNAPVDPATPHSQQDPIHRIYNVFANAFKHGQPQMV